TRFGWNVDLSGKTEPDLLAELGRRGHTLCTVCFPTAPVLRPPDRPAPAPEPGPSPTQSVDAAGREAADGAPPGSDPAPTETETSSLATNTAVTAAPPNQTLTEATAPAPTAWASAVEVIEDGPAVTVRGTTGAPREEQLRGLLKQHGFFYHRTSGEWRHRGHAADRVAATAAIRRWLDAQIRAHQPAPAPRTGP